MARWPSGTREKLANIKAFNDVMTGCDPVLGQPAASAQIALAH